MTTTPSVDEPVIHLFEPGGRGGVYQHAVAVSAALSRSGRQVRLHTAIDHELPDLGLDVCTCFDWHRSATRGRGARVGAGFVFRTLPHLLTTRGTLWVQGGFKLPLILLLLTVTKVLGRRVLFSPHNLFVRDRRASQWLLDRCLRAGATNVTYNKVDTSALRRRNLACRQAPLLMYAPEISSAAMDRWGREIDDHNITVCSVGQLRKDKNLDLLVEATGAAGVGLILAGADAGAAAKLFEQIAGSNSHVRMHCRYLELEEIAAIISCSTVVALPYSVASQSAVAVLARAYQTPVVALDTGGLAEQADILVDNLDVASWATTLREAVADAKPRRRRTPAPPSTEDVATLVDVVAGQK